MPFSCLQDPDDLERARRTLDAAWATIEQRGRFSGEPESGRQQLAYIVAGLINTPMSSKARIATAVARFHAELDELRGTGKAKLR